jgi:hypothetical protein
MAASGALMPLGAAVRVAHAEHQVARTGPCRDEERVAVVGQTEEAVARPGRRPPLDSRSIRRR